MSSIGHIFNIEIFVYLEGIIERESMESLQECRTFFQLFRNFLFISHIYFILFIFHQIDRYYIFETFHISSTRF